MIHIKGNIFFLIPNNLYIYFVVYYFIWVETKAFLAKKQKLPIYVVTTYINYNIIKQ